MFAILLRVFKAPHRRNVAILLGAVGAVVLIGAGLFSLAESLPFTTGLYWAVTTATTVGYGDITPHNPVGRLIASLVMLTTIPMLAAAFALVSGAAAAAGVRRILNMRTQFPEGTYRLVIGMNPIVPALIAELSRARIPVVLVADVAPETLPDVHVVRGDPTDEKVIAKAKPAGAEQALITGASDGDVLVSAVLLRKQAASLPVTALVTSPAIREALRDLGIEQSVSASELVSRTLAASLETPHAGELISQLVGSRDALAEIEMTESAFGKRLSAIRNEHADLVLGLVHGSQFTLGIGDDPVVAAGDRLLVAKADTARE